MKQQFNFQWFMITIQILCVWGRGVNMSLQTLCLHLPLCCNVSRHMITCDQQQESFHCKPPNDQCNTCKWPYPWPGTPQSQKSGQFRYFLSHCDIGGQSPAWNIFWKVGMSHIKLQHALVLFQQEPQTLSSEKNQRLSVFLGFSLLKPILYQPSNTTI